MATAGDIVNGALGFILVRAAEEPVSAADMADSISILNDMLNSWAVGGIRLGYQSVEGAADEISAPDAALLAIKQNLAVQLGPIFGMPVSPDLYNNANTSLKALRRLVIKPPTSSYPETLPRGSGNRGYWRADDTFYPDSATDLALLYFTAPSFVTSLTKGIPVALGVTWTTKEISGFTQSSGILSWTGTGISSFRVRASMFVQLAGSEAELALYVARNGRVIPSSAVTKTDDTTGVTLDLDFGAIGLATDDTITLFLENRSNDYNATIEHATLEVTECA